MKQSGCDISAVKTRFDLVADNYDKKQEVAKCFATEYIRRAFDRLNEKLSKHMILDVLDLGCGTGMCGNAFRPFASMLDGVDLSEKMLEKAHSLAVYDHLYLDDIQSYLGKTTQQYDLITLASVFLYFSNVQPALDGCYSALRRNGILIFTADRHDDPDVDVQINPRNSMMYTHSRRYLERCVSTAGFRLVSLEEIDERLAWKDLAPVPAFVVTAIHEK